jgi:murein L,D-transpeptidase YafK
LKERKNVKKKKKKKKNADKEREKNRKQEKVWRGIKKKVIKEKTATTLLSSLSDCNASLHRRR